VYYTWVRFEDRKVAMYDVIVVGAGHAGCEAALAAARMGCRTLLVTMNLDLIATMPCNPGVGGPAKGHLVKEIDALGGEMAHNLDQTFIQIRLLNLSKGPAVRAPRAQADKRLYSLAMKDALEMVPNLDLKQGLVEKLLVEGGQVNGVVTSLGVVWRGRTVILATGTFLGARIMTGEIAFPAGRAGEFPATGLSASLRELGFTLGRLQTNTPPRINAHTIDFSQTTPQLGSETPLYFGFRQPTLAFQHPEHNPVYPIPHQTDWRAQLPCYLVHTNEGTHQIVRENLHRSPIASGFLEGVGPRYCPSFEEKIVRFAHKDSHQFFLEPEGWRTTEVYVQGMYTAMPYDVQLAMLRSIPALRKAEIVRPGYAVEYDFVPPDQIKASLETKQVEGLFHAGQINGTSGYEEAAAQGIMAGLNAARKVQGKGPIVLRRDQAYIGVLIDDLVTKEITEPYRMMTSRAEYRLLLRQDNADLRLSPIGYEVGLLPRERYEAVEEKREAIEGELRRLTKTWLAPSEKTNEKLIVRGLDPLDDGVNALQFLRRPEVTYDLIEAFVPSPRPLFPEAIEQVTIEAKYTGYIKKQRREVERLKRLEERPIPDDFDYEVPVGLRNEAREKLMRFRPATLGQASRLSGVNPTDVSILLICLERTT
jgi:tRNA uridine 5-carboxymethylaminomethyl modification enzyme